MRRFILLLSSGSSLLSCVSSKEEKIPQWEALDSAGAVSCDDWPQKDGDFSTEAVWVLDRFSGS